MSGNTFANFTQVGICGSGTMGAGLAEVIARAGIDVIVCSRTTEAAKTMLATVTTNLAKQVAKEKMSEDDKSKILSHVQITSSLTDLADCDLVIESVVEDLAAKQQLFAKLDAIVNKLAILATNTSTLAVVDMARTTQRPDQVCGIHFFNPAVIMPLVEIIRPITASDDTIARAAAFVQACGKDGVHVLDRAGFIVNALLFPYLNNAVRMLESGTASMEDIDTAMKGGCNFPMGPFALLDLVGLDTSVSILDALYAEFNDDNYQTRPSLRRLVAEGKLGRKTGQGFFTY
ncbi:MAG: 3-hydroxyacyl-CoA dehydrogenase family protein [Ilumatobacteraceae bacterium]